MPLAAQHRNNAPRHVTEIFVHFLKSSYLQHYPFPTEGTLISLTATLKSSSPITALKTHFCH